MDQDWVCELVGLVTVVSVPLARTSGGDPIHSTWLQLSMKAVSLMCLLDCDGRALRLSDDGWVVLDDGPSLELTTAFPPGRPAGRLLLH